MTLFHPDVELELDEGERIVLLGRRHWIELLQSSFLFLGVGLVTGAIVLFRALGGSFFEIDAADPGWDAIVIFLLLLSGALAFLWNRTGGKIQTSQKSSLNISWLYGIVILLLLASAGFHYLGGRIFYLNPYTSNSMDLINIVLAIVSFLSLAFCVYLYIDWADDFLVVTNTRVVYDDHQVLVRHIQQQILIDDIQQVNMRSDTYIAYWLRYGTIVLRSFSASTLTFRNAASAKALQNAIQGQLSALRKQQEPEILRGMLEDRVYGNKPPKKPGPPITVRETHGPLPWLFKANPEIDAEKEIIIWRPYWVFLALQLARPVGAFLLFTIALILTVNFSIIPTGWGITIWLISVPIFFLWAWYVYEDHENDVFILTRQDITDVDKRPLGPESRRRAPLSSIQDVSYNVSFWEQILGYGTVIIKTGGAAGGAFTFNHVPDPRAVQATINDYLTDFRKHEKEREFQTALTLIREYHQLRLQHGEIIDEDEISAKVADRLFAEVPDRVSEQVREQVADIVSQRVPEEMRKMLRKSRGDLSSYWRRGRRRADS